MEKYSVREGSDSWSERNKKIGKYGVDTLVLELTCKGYRVQSFPVEANGVDIIAENDTHVLAIERINWKESCKLKLGRLKQMKRNWYDIIEEYANKGDNRTIVKVLVYNYEHNIEDVLPYLLMLEVELWKRGYQDIPEYKEEENEIRGWIE